MYVAGLATGRKAMYINNLKRFLIVPLKLFIKSLSVYSTVYVSLQY